MKKLPEIYKKEIQKKINNNKEYTYVQKEEKENLDLENLLFQIFQEKSSHKRKVWIKTKNDSFETYLLGKTKESIITSSQDIILKKDILECKRIH